MITATISAEFLAGGGAMGEHIRAYPWEDTLLDEPQSWPQGLRTAVRVMLTTQHPVFIFWGPEHTCLYNDAYSRSLGPEKHPSILGTPGRAAWVEIWPIIGPQIEQVMRGDGATWHENQLVPSFRYGELQDVYWTYSYSPIDDPESASGVGGVLVLCSETTESMLAQQRLADRALALSRSRLEYASRLSGIGYWYCDLPFHELDWDEQVKEHFFLPSDAVVTIDEFYARIHKDDRAATRTAINASIHSGVPYDIVYRTVHPGTGAVKWIRALGGTDYASDGTPTRFDGVTVDVSAQKRDEQRLSTLNQLLQEQDRRKDEFIATLSHELRNPLAPILTAARGITSQQLSSAQLQRAGLVIERQATQMALLLDDLLDIARITQGKLQLRKETVKLAEVVDAAIDAVRPALNAKQQEVSVSLPETPVLMQADSLRLSQVLTNLLMNAAKYSDVGSHIAVTGVVQDDTVAVSVNDDGIGIAQEDICGVFEMFSQVGAAGSSSDGGLGIGLALVRGLVELHGGSVEACSGGLGLGSEFTVRLPVAPAQPDTVSLRPEPVRLQSVPRRILIADDNRDAADTLSTLLQLAGHDVRVAYHGRQAIDLARQFLPDTALLDIGMPDLTGYEVARELRGETWSAQMQLIALTGWGQESDRRQAMQAGFNHHLVKPVDPGRLEELIQMWATSG